MRIEQTRRWPAVPWWAIVLVLGYLALIGVYLLATRDQTGRAPPLCWFHRLTGYPCPTCGTTRLVLALGRGDVRAALAHNPLVFAGLVFGALWLLMRVGFRRRIVWADSPTQRRLLAVGLVGALLANWLYLLATD